MSMSTDADALPTLLKTFEEAAAAVVRHFGEREGQRELRIEEFRVHARGGLRITPAP